MMGPVDYIAVGFEGGNFDGTIFKEITKASSQGIIRVLDLIFIVKDKKGNVEEAEYQEQSDSLKETFGDFNFSDDAPLLTDADVAKVGEMMDNDTAAGILLIEHLWALGIKKAIMDTGGFLIADGRIHPEKVAEAVKELEHANV